MLMWEEWRTTVWQRLLGTVFRRECGGEACQRNDGKRVSSKPPPPCLNLWKNRNYPKEKKQKKGINLLLSVSPEAGCGVKVHVMCLM